MHVDKKFVKKKMQVFTENFDGKKYEVFEEDICREFVTMIESVGNALGYVLRRGEL